MKRYFYNQSNKNSTIGDGWSWYQWLVSNEAGATADISALAQIQKLTTRLINVSGIVTETSLGRRLRILQEEELANTTLAAAPVCVPSPFVFLLTNVTNATQEVDCRSTNCFLAQCWNASWNLVVVMKIPTFVPIPVKTDPDTFPLVTLLRGRRDFGLTAAIVTAIAVSAAAAVTAAVAMTNQVQTADTINNVVAQAATVLDTQSRINRHMLSGIVAANQRIDFLQSQMDDLADLVQMGCILYQKHVCITPLSFDNSRNESKILGEFLAGNWSKEAENLIQDQLLQIATLNDTPIQPMTLGQFTDWLQSAFSFFKEWVGVGVFGAICCLGMFLCLWHLRRFRARQARDKAIIVQALAALEHGISPQVWLSSLKHDL